MKSTNLFTCLSILAIVGAGFLSPVQAAQKNHIAHNFRIMHHEAIKTMRFTEQANATDSGRPSEGQSPVTFSFNAYGRNFSLDLETNEHLLDNLPKAQKQRLKQSIRIYKGKIAGIADSWVRINRTGDKVSGAFWDGSELYLIDNSNDITSAIDSGLDRRKFTKAYPLVYRFSDTETDSSCAVEPQPAAANSFSNLVGELQALAQTSTQADRSLDVAIVADAEFTQANSANPHAAVIARMNVVDGIYTEQVGVHLNIIEVRPLASNGSMIATSPSLLLQQFASYTASPGFNNPGLTHLFTGRDLDGNTVGIAYIGVLCRKDAGVGLSQTTGTGTAGALTVAHEIGHNFGAPHDAEAGSACSSSPDTFIMNPVLNGSNQFSACSLQQMVPNIAAAACMSDVTPVALTADVRPVIPVNPISAKASTNFNYVVEVRNNGTVASENTTADIAIPSGLSVNTAKTTLGQCAVSASDVKCSMGSLASNTTATITLNLKSGSTSGNLVSTVKVSANNDSNTSNNSANVAINIAPQPPTTQKVIFESDFNNDDGGFFYLDDMYRDTKQYKYASGSHVVNRGNGQLQILLGGRDNIAVTNGMSGGWRKKFTLTAPSTVTLSFDYKIVQTANYEADEHTDAVLALDWKWIGLNGGDFLSRVTGDGNGGSPRSSGIKTVTITRGVLAAGTHTIVIGGFNNKKDASDERSQVFIDNVKLVIK